MKVVDRTNQAVQRESPYVQRNKTGVQRAGYKETKQVTKPWTVKQEVESYGVACCRRNAQNQPELMMVCKRVSYAFVNFVLCKYRARDDSAVSKLLDQMTTEEKLDILTLNFDQMWHRAWLQQTHRIGLFKRSKSQFETSFLLPDGGHRLTQLVISSRNSRPRWEIPKGHKKLEEGAISCAVREFEEETNNAKKTYELLSFKPHKQSFVDAGIRYTFSYFLANSISATAEVNLGSDSQCEEITDVRWMDITTIKSIDYDGRLAQISKTILKSYTVAVRP